VKVKLPARRARTWRRPGAARERRVHYRGGSVSVGCQFVGRPETSSRCAECAEQPFDSRAV